MDRNFRKIQGLGNHIRQWDNQTLCGLFWLLAQRSGTMCHEGWLQPHGSLNLENVAGGHEEMTELTDSSMDDVTGGTNIVVIKSPKVQSGQTDAFSELAESIEFKKIR